VVEPFRIHVPEAALEDLRARLARTRLPDALPDAGWTMGADLGYMRSLVAYWLAGFDWRAQEARLNAFPQFKVPLHDIDVHFLHVPGKGPNPSPLLLMHGWPGSVFEFLDLIPRLTRPAAFGADPADAFTVVAPSLPGYGLSFAPGQKRFSIEDMAECFAELMPALGYGRFGAQGGDWGSAVTTTVGELYRERVLGIHVNMPTVPLGPLTDDATERERTSFDDFAWHTQWGTGYQHQQSTRPQTLGYGLADSPVGQLAWIVEKFWAWTDCDGDPLSIFTRDQLLDNVSIYWFTGTGASSARLYWESAGPAPPLDPAAMATQIGPVTVPTGCSVFPREIRRPSRRWAERRFTNIHWWNEPAKGGHFAAFEQPELFVDEVRSSFRPLR
jgi:microsomal epoxide hydrolase